MPRNRHPALHGSNSRNCAMPGCGTTTRRICEACGCPCCPSHSLHLDQHAWHRGYGTGPYRCDACVEALLVGEEGLNTPAPPPEPHPGPGDDPGHLDVQNLAEAMLEGIDEELPQMLRELPMERQQVVCGCQVVITVTFGVGTYSTDFDIRRV